MQDGQPERQRLARARLGGADHVAAPLDGGVQNLALDRRRVREAHVLQRAQKFRVQVELEPVGDVRAGVQVHAVHHRAETAGGVVVVVHVPPRVLRRAGRRGGDTFDSRRVSRVVSARGVAWTKHRFAR